MLNVPENHLTTIKEILRKYLSNIEVRAFGSRLTDKIKKYSDLDLVVVGKEKIERRKMVGAKEAFESSNLPFRVDLLDWNRISDKFKKIILENYAVIQSA
ncbi:MAG: nucleotidyltransferase domain-containing protein [Candidatus Margulisbacteria bacterium]|nr:nucleotidyltransferase domain-containing protein [Candidatus Margulisiibacteriota bacterium]